MHRLFSLLNFEKNKNTNMFGKTVTSFRHFGTQHPASSKWIRHRFVAKWKIFYYNFGALINGVRCVNITLLDILCSIVRFCIWFATDDKECHVRASRNIQIDGYIPMILFTVFHTHSITLFPVASLCCRVPFTATCLCINVSAVKLNNRRHN